MDGLNFAHYGEEREIDATDEELQIFDIIKETTGCDELELVRKSNNYVSAVIGLTDVARFKFTKKAKWIQLPYLLKDKVKLLEPNDVYDLKEDLIRAVEFSKNN